MDEIVDAVAVDEGGYSTILFFFPLKLLQLNGCLPELASLINNTH